MITRNIQVSIKDPYTGIIAAVGGDDLEELQQTLAGFVGGNLEDANKVIQYIGTVFAAEADQATLARAAAVAQAALGPPETGQEPSAGQYPPPARNPRDRGSQGRQNTPPALSGIKCDHGITARVVNGKNGAFYVCGLPYKHPEACGFKQDGGE
jgi:hypothetical protein